MSSTENEILLLCLIPLEIISCVVRHFLNRPRNVHDLTHVRSLMFFLFLATSFGRLRDRAIFGFDSSPSSKFYTRVVNFHRHTFVVRTLTLIQVYMCKFMCIVAYETTTRFSRSPIARHDVFCHLPRRNRESSSPRAAQLKMA